jgi:hypothetical protein
MTEEDYGIGKPIDKSYIDVEVQRSDISHSGEAEKNDNMDRSQASAQNFDVSAESTDMSHRFDDASGSGASGETEELIDKNAIIENDGRSTTRTFYYPSEAPERVQKQFARMLRWQDGEYDESTPGGRRGQNLRADTRRWAETFTSHLGMNSYQQDRVLHIVEDLTMAHMAHYSAQEVILGTITIVANEDDRFIRDEQAFKDLVDDVGSDMYTIKRVRGLVREKSDQL